MAYNWRFTFPKQILVYRWLQSSTVFTASLCLSIGNFFATSFPVSGDLFGIHSVSVQRWCVPEVNLYRVQFPVGTVEFLTMYKFYFSLIQSDWKVVIFCKSLWLLHTFITINTSCFFFCYFSCYSCLIWNWESVKLELLHINNVHV